MALISAGSTDIGLKRKTNQDALYLSDELKLYMVADGMGGHNGGDIASQMAVTKFPHEFIKNTHLPPTEQIKTSFINTNQAIKSYANQHPELIGMGTTIVNLYFDGPTLYIGNIGDSRAYLFSQQKIYQLTRDHSLVQEKLNYGVYNREQALLDQQKNVLVKTVGFEDHTTPDIFNYKIIKHDLFLICSDGLHGKVSDEDILFLSKECLRDPATATKENLQNFVAQLIELANSNGGQDNITAIAVLAR